MYAQFKNIIAIMLMAALLCLGAGNALAQEHHHGHADEATTSKFALNHGKRWVTDANLRQAMNAIRDALSAELHAIHSDKATQEQYRVLSQKVHQQVDFIMNNCKLERRTDDMFHFVLADIVAGADDMAGTKPGQARGGAEKIIRALQAYGTHFDHPGWQMPR